MRVRVSERDKGQRQEREGECMKVRRRERACMSKEDRMRKNGSGAILKWWNSTG